MELIIFLGLIVIGLQLNTLWQVMSTRRELQNLRNLFLKTTGTTQSTVKHQKRSDPYPRIPRPKAEQHYAGQGTPRPLPGAEPRKVTASGTAVRIGKVAQRRVGGTTGDPEGS
ncbi:hypothetical protein SEA_HUWBERT_24 [Microbacterium phage Huwbert]|nr:hypothetical protein SEA_HUWBERT_24 [Microbacterium phage Huwbert]